MKLDSEQKRVLKAVSGSSLGFIFGNPLLMWVFGKLDSWKDALLYMGIGLIILGIGIFILIDGLRK
jgi:hypothetical protein